MKKPQAEKTDRKHQPQCKECSHPKSFHGGGTTKCRALGCTCKAWKPMPKAKAVVDVGS